MPTRRIMELVIVTVILTKPVLQMIHLWSTKTLGTKDPNTILHKMAEVGVVIS